MPTSNFKSAIRLHAKDDDSLHLAWSEPVASDNHRLVYILLWQSRQSNRWHRDQMTIHTQVIFHPPEGSTSTLQLYLVAVSTTNKVAEVFINISTDGSTVLRTTTTIPAPTSPARTVLLQVRHPPMTFSQSPELHQPAGRSASPHTRHISLSAKPLPREKAFTMRDLVLASVATAFVGFVIGSLVGVWLYYCRQQHKLQAHHHTLRAQSRFLSCGITPTISTQTLLRV